MKYYHVLLHPTIVTATLLYGVFVIAFEIFSNRFLHKIEEAAPSHWIAEQVLVPFMRVVLMVAYIIACYPIIYGIAEAPAMSELLQAGDGQMMRLINIVFFISVILPLVPVIGKLTAFILPLQAIAAAAVIFSWYAHAVNMDYRLLPDFSIFAWLFILSFLAQRTAGLAAEQLGPYFKDKYHIDDADALLKKICLLLLQVPVLLVYTLNLTP